MIEHIKRYYRYKFRGEYDEMCAIMDGARSIAMKSHKNAAVYVLTCLETKKYLLDHKKIRKQYDDIVKVYGVTIDTNTP